MDKGKARATEAMDVDSVDNDMRQLSLVRSCSRCTIISSQQLPQTIDKDAQPAPKRSVSVLAIAKYAHISYPVLYSLKRLLRGRRKRPPGHIR